MRLIEDLYCSLYVKSPEDQDVVRAVIANAFGGKIARRSVLDEYLEVYFTNNEDFLPDQMNKKGGFVYYPYRAEIQPSYGMKDGVTSEFQEIFLDLLSQVIIELRKSGAQVVASCGYEDVITEKTGWNWSVSTPDHPSIT